MGWGADAGADESPLLRHVGHTTLARQVEPDHVSNWIDTHKGAWGNNYTNRAIGVVVAAFYFAMKKGRLRDRAGNRMSNPLEKIDRPSLQLRVVMLTAEQETALYEVSERKNPQFVDYFSFLIATGCRPAEAAKIEACHCKETAEGVQVSLPAFAADGTLGHKTGRKGGRPRIIYCNAEASAGTCQPV